MNKEVGRLGEQKAVDYLLKSGFKIMERNFRCKIGEIDLIAYERGEIIFFEVKARKSKRYGEPYEAVNLKKQERIRNVANYYLLTHRKCGVPCRFDVISIIFDDENRLVSLEHLRQAF